MLAASLAAGIHVVLEGPPGTGKSTLLRAVADGAGLGVEFVEGNAELTPARLVGHFDPALVLEAGYKPEIFVDGPLITALREGRLLVHRGAQPRAGGDPERARRRAGRGRDPRAAARPHPGQAEFPADRGHEPVRRGRHRACEPGDRRPHVPDRDRLPGRTRRAGDRRARHRRRRPAGEERRRAHAAHAHAPERADGFVRARGDRPRPARARSRARCAARTSRNRATTRTPTPRSRRCPAGSGSRRGASGRRRRSCSS